MSHSKKAARLTALTLAAALVLATPALAARRGAAASERSAAVSWISALGLRIEKLVSLVLGTRPCDPRQQGPGPSEVTLGSADRELGRGPYIDPNGGPR